MRDVLYAIAFLLVLASVSLRLYLAHDLAWLLIVAGWFLGMASAMILAAIFRGMRAR